MGVTFSTTESRTHPARRRCRCWRRGAGCRRERTRRSPAAGPPPVPHPPARRQQCGADILKAYHVLPAARWSAHGCSTELLAGHSQQGHARTVARFAVVGQGDKLRSQQQATALTGFHACALLRNCTAAQPCAKHHRSKWRRTSLTGMSRAPWMPLAALGDPGAAAPSKNPAGSPAPLRALISRSVSLPHVRSVND